MRHPRFLALCAAAAILAVLPARAQPPSLSWHVEGGDRVIVGDGPAMILPMLLDSGDLSPEQRDKVRAIMKADRDKIRGLFRQMDEANDALADRLLAPGSVDSAELRPLVERVDQIRQQLMDQGIKTALAIRAVLTPEQLARGAKKKAKMRELQTEMRKLLEPDPP